MELSLKKLFGDSRYLIQSIHAKKLQVRIFSRLGWISPLLLGRYQRAKSNNPKTFTVISSLKLAYPDHIAIWVIPNNENETLIFTH